MKITKSCFLKFLTFKNVINANWQEEEVGCYGIDFMVF